MLVCISLEGLALCIFDPVLNINFDGILHGASHFVSHYVLTSRRKLIASMVADE